MSNKQKPFYSNTGTIPLKDIADNPEQLLSLSIKQLKHLWQQHFPRKPRPHLKMLLIRSLANKAQNKYHGELNLHIQKAIHQQSKTYIKKWQININNDTPINNTKSATVLHTTQKVPSPLKDLENKKKSNIKYDYRLQLHDGMTLTRQWNGRAYSIRVRKTKSKITYQFRNTNYRSLSKIAKDITGSHWSGPRFFGLHKTTSPPLETAYAATSKHQ